MDVVYVWEWERDGEREKEEREREIYEYCVSLGKLKVGFFVFNGV